MWPLVEEFHQEWLRFNKILKEKEKSSRLSTICSLCNRTSMSRRLAACSKYEKQVKRPKIFRKGASKTISRTLAVSNPLQSIKFNFAKTAKFREPLSAREVIRGNFPKNEKNACLLLNNSLHVYLARYVQNSSVVYSYRRRVPMYIRLK